MLGVKLSELQVPYSALAFGGVESDELRYFGSDHMNDMSSSTSHIRDKRCCSVLRPVHARQALFH